MKNIIQIVFVIIGTFIGAGFASGQEINTFFFSYGTKGIIGIFISSIFMAFIIYKTLKLIHDNDIKSYKQLLNNVIKNNKLKEIINALINVFFITSFFIMIAGFGAYLKQEFQINNIIGSSILAILCIIILNKNIKGFIKVNELLIPVLILIVLLIGIINFSKIDINNIDKHLFISNSGNWMVKSILYASYNSILLIPILINVKSIIKNKKQIKYITIISSFIIFLLLTIVFSFLINIDVDIKQLEMPAVFAINSISKNLKIIYGITILISIFTTAVSVGISFLSNVSKSKKSYTQLSYILCITSIFFSQIGFSNLVNMMYPILGALGLIQIIKIILKSNKKQI